MLLYFVYDTTNLTFTPPIMAPDLNAAIEALKKINPENLDTLEIHAITEISTITDLFQLEINYKKPYPDLIKRSDDSLESSTQQAERVSSDLDLNYE